MKTKPSGWRAIGKALHWTCCGLLLSTILAFPAWGQDLEWAKQAGGEGENFARSVAVDGAGNSLVVGTFEGTVTFGGGETNETVLTSSDNNDVFIAKYAKDGSLVWVRVSQGVLGTTPWGTALGIAADGAGNSLVTGYFHGVETFGFGEANETTLTSIGDLNNIFIAKYASDGSLLWARQDGGSGDGIGNSITFDVAGQVLVTGRFSGTAVFGAGETNETVLNISNSTGMFVAKYTSAGRLLWAEQAGIDSTSAVIGNGIASDVAGNGLVTGYFSGSATFGAGEANATVLTSSGALDIFVAKYGNNSSLLWARRAGGLSDDRGYNIAVDTAGNSLVTGAFGGTATFGAGESNATVLTSSGALDIYVAKYGSDGSLLWAKRPGGSNYDQGYGIAVDGEGNGYVTGYFLGSATFGSGEAGEIVLTSDGAGYQDMFVAKYANGGSLLWAAEADAGVEAGITGRGVAADGAGGCSVTGSFVGTATFGAGETNETALTGSGVSDIFVARYSGGDAVQNLIDQIESFNLNQGLAASLEAKLWGVAEAMAASHGEQRQNAANLLEAFIKAVNALSGKALTTEQAAQLIDQAEQVLSGLQ